MSSLYLTTGLMVLVYFSLLFAIACKIKNYAIADIGWGAGFILTAGVSGYMASITTPFYTLVFGLVCLWGIRLSIHIYLRNKGKDEDFRYQNFRKQWIKHPYLQAYIKLYLTQALLTLIVSTAIFIAVTSEASELNLLSILFACVALFGFLYESISDYQLVKFKKTDGSSGKIMRQGLWRYSRHPNYFGEIVFWWGISLLVATTTGNYLALTSGLVMNLLIVFVSGVPMLEAKYKSNPAYEDYIRSTNSLIPIKFR